MKTTIEKVILLQSIEIFSDLPTEHLSFLAGIAEPMTYEKDEVLFKENEPSDALYIVGSGEIHLYREDSFVSEIAEKQAAGVLGFFDQEPRIFTARCQTTCHVLVIDAMDFFDILEDKVHITEHLLRYFVTQLRAIHSQGKQADGLN